MDLDGHTGMTLDELKASAPRSFDKTLVDLIAAIQRGETPIAQEQPDVAPALAQMADLVLQQRETIERLQARVGELEAFMAALINASKAA